MAWPLSVRTVYTAGTLPAIKAADLNAIQDAIVGIYAGTLSVKSLDVDGTGGAASSVLAGTIRLATTFTGTTAPTTTVPAGTLTRAACPVGWAEVSSAGALVLGYNIRSTARVGAGYYEIVLNAVTSNPTKACVLANPRGGLVPAYAQTFAYDDGGGRQGAKVFMWNKDGVDYDGDFYVVVFGE